MRNVKRKARNVSRWSFVLCSMIMAITVPVLAACAGNPALSDPRQMTFPSVSSPRQNRIAWYSKTG